MIGDLIGEWIKGILIDGIMGNLSGLFNTVNTKVGEIASDVGSTPQDWNGGIFSMLQNLSETVIVPIAAAILALVMLSLIHIFSHQAGSSRLCRVGGRIVVLRPRPVLRIRRYGGRLPRKYPRWKRKSPTHLHQCGGRL